MLNLTNVPIHLCVDFRTLGWQGISQIKTYLWVAEVLDHQGNKRLNFALHFGRKPGQVWHQIVQDLVGSHEDFSLRLLDLQAGSEPTEKSLDTAICVGVEQGKMLRHGLGK